MQAVTDFAGGLWREGVKTLKILSRNTMGMIGFVLIVLIVFLSFVGPFIWPPETSANVAEINQGVSAQHWLGTDFQGQDNLIKIINGGRDIVLIAVLTGVLSMLIAVVVGSVSAFAGGWVDSVLMELVNIWLTIPEVSAPGRARHGAGLERCGDVVGVDGHPGVAGPGAPGAQPGALAQEPRLCRGGRHARSRHAAHHLPRTLAQHDVVRGDLDHLRHDPRDLSADRPCVPWHRAVLERELGRDDQRGRAAAACCSARGPSEGVLAPMAAIVIFQLALVSFARSLDEVFNPRLRTSV